MINMNSYEKINIQKILYVSFPAGTPYAQHNQYQTINISNTASILPSTKSPNEKPVWAVTFIQKCDISYTAKILYWV